MVQSIHIIMYLNQRVVILKNMMIRLVLSVFMNIILSEHFMKLMRMEINKQELLETITKLLQALITLISKELQTLQSTPTVTPILKVIGIFKLMVM